MNEPKNELWEKLKNYSLDDPGHQVTFSDKLAKENHWSPEFAQQVVQEYKKFVFLAMTCGHLVVPSDQVDQAWHKHILYTEKYERFCSEILGRKFHHGPSTGGKKEDEKHTNWYKKTKETYKEVFGEDPPVPVWPSSKMRFSERYVRVNPRKNIIIERASFPIISKIVIRLLIITHKIFHSKKSA